MKHDDARLAALAGRIATAVAILAAVAFPLSYFALSYQYQVASLETETAIYARTATDVVNRDPELWRFQVHGLEEILERRLPGAPAEAKRIADGAGNSVVETAVDLAPPVLTRERPLLDAGFPTGSLSISRSLRPLLLGTALAGVFGVLLGSVAFFTLRIFPMGALRRVLRTLFDEKERAQVTLHSIADGVIATDADRRVVLINDAAQTLTGWPDVQALGRTLEEVYRVETPDAAAPGSRRPNPPARLVSRDGSERLVSESVASIRDQDGAAAGVVVVFRDITDHRRLEDELIRAQKLESVGLLAGGIAHDFNNVLTAILGNITMARIRLGSVAGVTDRLEAAETAVQRASSLTRQLLTFSHGGAPVKQVVSLPEFLQDAVAFALTGSRVRCRFVLPKDLWPVEVDEGQMAQVVNNLVINADQAMPSGGDLTVSAYNLVVSGRDPLPLARGRYVKLTFADQGVGIPAENLKRIFDPFFTTKQTGTGLGLASTYSIVRRHGGHIVVESEPGVGTAFDIYLEASDRQPDRPARNQPSPAPGRGRILVMDDEAPIRDVALEILGELGYDAAVAADGAQAVEMYRASLEAGTPFDAVITDLTVPGGMGGEDAVRHLRDVDPGVRAIVSSGFNTDPILADFRAYGFVGVLPKPFKIHDLAALLDRVVGGPGS